MDIQYIEREAAKRELLSWAVCMNHPEYLMKDDALHIIDSIPAADVVEVVRCKDCRYFWKYSEKFAQEVEHADGYCFIEVLHGEEMQYFACKYDDYCSYGERRERECD